jgi:hypothetical protein
VISRVISKVCVFDIIAEHTGHAVEVAFRPDTPLNTLKNGPYVALLYVMGTYDFSLVSTFTIRFRF